jgi:hypothetical protein
MRRNEKILAGLLAVLLLGAAYYFVTSRGDGPGLPGVLAADPKFQPLDVQEPALRLDLLERTRNYEPTGSRRNIFLAAPPPSKQPMQVKAPPIFVGPQLPPPPPPLQVPVEFFGVASRAPRGRPVAFFSSGDDVLIAGEGDTFLTRFRLDRINKDSADVEEIATGRHATLPLVQPPTPGATQ